MALSLVPLALLGTIGFIGVPIVALNALHILMIIGWLPVLLGWVKTMVRLRSPLPASDDTAEMVADDELPSLTVLLPLYKEANMLGQIAEMLRAIEYPPQLLDCMLLLEAEDRETALAAMGVDWPSFARIVIVPDGAPRTKARACNYALGCSTSEMVVIFDAEDMPHPRQMREAAGRFKTADARLACLQAPLRICPQAGSWLQAQFAAEYRLLFGFMLPQLSEAMSCLPLGGSSNYFRRAALNHVGGWDDYNLTEDADLALRFAGFGYRIGTLTRETLENAPHRLGIWFRQRTRWQSGHIQTLHAYGAWTLRHGWGQADGFRWRAVMLGCLAFLVVRLVSGTYFITSLVLLLGPFDVSLNPLFVQSSIAFYVFYVAILLQHIPATNWADRLGLLASHPLYWIMTFPAHLNAVKRMALGQTGWLKSAHQPYAL